MTSSLEMLLARVGRKGPPSSCRASAPGEPLTTSLAEVYRWRNQGSGERWLVQDPAGWGLGPPAYCGRNFSWPPTAHHESLVVAGQWSQTPG